MMTKTTDEKLLEVEQKIHRLQGEKRKLMRDRKNAERKKRDHVLILIGATFISPYADDFKAKLYNASDEQIVAWVTKELSNRSSLFFHEVRTDIPSRPTVCKVFFRALSEGVGA